MTQQPAPASEPRPSSALSWPRPWQTIAWFLLLVVWIASLTGAVFALLSGGFGVDVLVTLLIAAIVTVAMVLLERRRVAAWRALGVVIGRAAR